MTIKVQIQTPEQETSYLLIARSWESPEGKDHLIYPAPSNFFGRYLLLAGTAEVTAQTGIYSDVENQVTIFYLLMSIGFASSRLWKTRVGFVCEANTRDQFLWWHLFMETAKSSVSALKWKKKNLSESMLGCGNKDEFWNVREFRLGTTDVQHPKVHPQSQAWIFSVTAPVNCPVRYYLLNIYCLFPVHVWWGSQEI